MAPCAPSRRWHSGDALQTVLCPSAQPVTRVYLSEGALRHMNDYLRILPAFHPSGSKAPSADITTEKVISSRSIKLSGAGK
jgi:hypothetical protein